MSNRYTKTASRGLKSGDKPRSATGDLDTFDLGLKLGQTQESRMQAWSLVTGADGHLAILLSALNRVLGAKNRSQTFTLIHNITHMRITTFSASTWSSRAQDKECQTVSRPIHDVQA